MTTSRLKELRNAARPRILDGRVVVMPSMAAINAYQASLRNSAPIAVSTFSGMGGTSIGMKMAGYRVVYGNEFVPVAAQTYRDNHPTTYLDTRDIRRVTGSHIRRKSGISDREIDLLDGSPPCKAFSLIRNRFNGSKLGETEHYEAGIHQRLDDLFFEFARILNELQPRAFTAENVEGLLSKTNATNFAHVMQTLTHCGYNVKASLIDGSWMGVSQKRRRLIIIGIRNDLQLEPQFAKPLYFQCRICDVPALKHIQEFKNDDYFVAPDKPFDCITASDHSISETAEFSAGGFVKDGKNHVWRGRNVDFRKLTIKELKILSSVPTDFKLPEKFSDAWVRLGRIRLPAEAYFTCRQILRTLNGK